VLLIEYRLAKLESEIFQNRAEYSVMASYLRRFTTSASAGKSL
jgi:hypothetical protein